MADIATPSLLEGPADPEPGVSPVSTGRTGAKDSSAATRLRRLLLLAVIWAFGACIAIDVLIPKGANSDLWFHLSTGAWIAQHHRVPLTDPLSSDGIHKTYIAYTWLFDLTLYWSYRWLGLVGTSLYVVALAGAIGIAFYRAIQKRMAGFAGPIALTGAGLFVMAPLYSERPWLWSILFSIIELDILFAVLVDPPERPDGDLVPATDDRARSNTRNNSWRIWVLPAVFVLWANLHIQWVYGVAILGLAAVTRSLAFVPPAHTNRSSAPSDLDRRAQVSRLGIKLQPGWHRLWVVTGLCWLATLITPYTWRLYLVVLEYAREKVPLQMIQEMQAPDFRSPLHYVLILIVLGAAFVLGRKSFRSSVFLGVLLVTSTLASLRTARDEWFAVIVSSLIIAVAYAKDAEPAEAPLPRFHRVIAGVVAVLLVLSWAGKRDLSSAHVRKLVAEHYPVQAAEFVAQNRISGPLFNDYNWGGYLTWRLPQLPVSMDGRAWVYGDAAVKRNIDTWDARDGWHDDPELSSANVVIAPAKSRLSTALKDDPRFQLAYHDDVALVFTKKGA